MVTANLRELFWKHMRIPAVGTKTESVGLFLKQKEYSKLIGILRCALIQMFDSRVSDPGSDQKKDFNEQCKKYLPNRLEELSFAPSQTPPQASTPVEKGFVIYVPQMRLHEHVLAFFPDHNKYDELFKDDSFKNEPTLVVRIKRVYNLLLNLENYLNKGEQSLPAAAFSALRGGLQPLFTDLFNLDIDILSLLKLLIPGLQDFIDSIPENHANAAKDLNEAAKDLAKFSGDCGFFLGLFLSQTNPKYQSLIGLQEIYTNLDALTDNIDKTSRHCYGKLVSILNTEPGSHHVKAIESLRVSTRNFLETPHMTNVVEALISENKPEEKRRMKSAGKRVMSDNKSPVKLDEKSLAKDEFFDKLRDYVAEIQGHFVELMPIIGGEGDFVSLKFSSFLNLQKLYQLVALIKLVGQNAYQLKDKTKILEKDLKNAVLLLLGHLKYNVLLRAINYVDVLQINLLLKTNLQESGVSLTETLEIYFQKIYATLVSTVKDVCPFEDYPQLEYLFDESFNARRQEWALKKCAHIHGENLEHETVENNLKHFEEFLRQWEPTSNFFSPDPDVPARACLAYSLSQNESEKLKPYFNISYPLLQQYYPEFTEDFRQTLEEGKSLFKIPENLSLVYEKLQQEQAMYALQQKVLASGIEELSKINRSTVSFFELSLDKEFNSENLLAAMKYNYAICKDGENYFLLNKLAETYERINAEKYQSLSKICEKFFIGCDVFYLFTQTHDCQALAKLLGYQADYFLDGCAINDDVLELSVKKLSTDISSLLKAELIDVYSGCQVQLIQLNSYNKSCEDWFTALSGYSLTRHSLKQLTSEEFAQLKYLFSMAKPLLKLAYAELQWKELLCGLQKQGELALANMRLPHQDTVRIAKHKLEGLLKAQQEEVKQAYERAVIKDAATTKLQPNRRKDKLISHENCSTFLDQLMQFFSAEIPKHLSPVLAKELELKKGALLYPLSETYVLGSFSMPDPMLVHKLPKQVANFMWLYNCLFHLRALAHGMEAATGTLGWQHVPSQVKMVATFLEVLTLFIYYRPSAQPGFHHSQPVIFIEGYDESRTSSSTSMLQRWGERIKGPLSALQEKMSIEKPSAVHLLPPNAQAIINKKHNFRSLITQMYSLAFLLKYYTGQHQAQKTDIELLHQKSSGLADRIDVVCNLSWNSFFFELINLWRCLNGVCELMHETMQSIKQLSYDHFQLIRKEMYEIYATVDALENDIGLKEGSLLTKVELLLEPFTQKLLQAMRMPLEEYLRFISKQDVYAYRLQILQDKLRRLARDGLELELIFGRLDEFLNPPQPAKTDLGQCLDLVWKSSPPHTAGLRYIYRIIEQYAFLRPHAAVVQDQRIKDEDDAYQRYYSKNRADWGQEDRADWGQENIASGSQPQKPVLPNNFINFVKLVQAYISGRRKTVQMSVEMHRNKIRELEKAINSPHLPDDIKAYYERQKEFLIASSVRDLASSSTREHESCLISRTAYYKSCQILKTAYSEKISAHFSTDFVKTVSAECAKNIGEAERIFKQCTEEYKARFEPTTLQFKRRLEILEKIHAFKTYLTKLQIDLHSSWTEDKDTIGKKLALLEGFEKSLLSTEFTFANFNEQLSYSEITQMCIAVTWMQTLIQYALCLLEYIGLMKSQRHSFFYTLSDIAKEGRREEQNMASAAATDFTCSVALN